MDLSGRVVGRHDGLMYYTLGQRRGLGLGGTRESQNRWFVADKDLKNNRLVVSHGDESVLMSDALESDEINWIPFPPKEEKFECAAKFRYRQPEQRVTVERTGSGARVLFILRSGRSRRGSTSCSTMKRSVSEAELSSAYTKEKTVF